MKIIIVHKIKNFVSKLKPELKCYWFLAILRIFLTCLPQTGYIHPDEYFQSVEVFAGSVFNLQVSPPWEFNITNPIRSIPIVYVATSLPLSFLKILSFFIGPYIVTPYTILLIPRLAVCLISFISDFCLYRICFMYGQNFRKRLLIYASSYVPLIYCTRTFTNSLEMVLFNLLLYVVARSMAESEEILYHDNVLRSRFEKAENTPDQVRLDRIRKRLPQHAYNHAVWVVLIFVSGIFNRPTFVVYAIGPLFFWFQRGIQRDKSFALPFHTRFLIFFLYLVPMTFLFVLLDSMYYAHFTWGEFINGFVTWRSFVFTPLNFILYNTNKDNLVQHGLHPRWLHVLVNMPLLFNILGIAGLLVVSNLIYRSSQSYWTQLPKPQSITSMMTLSFLTPLAAFSLIPHQEPRFIMPILLPLVFLYSHVITKIDEDCPASTKRNLLKFKSLPFLSSFDNRQNIKGRYLTLINNPALKHNEHPFKQLELLKIWFIINLIFTIFYGFVHQAGVWPLVKSIKAELDVQPKYTTYYVFYTYTYPLPEHLLMQQKILPGRVQYFQIIRLSEENMLSKVLTTFNIAEDRRKTKKRSYKMFYSLPGLKLDAFQREMFKRNVTCTIRQRYFPHFTAEAFQLNMESSFYDIYRSFQLFLLELKLNI